MIALIDAVAAAGDRLVAASGGGISFDPHRALSRREDIDLGEANLWSPNRHCRLVECADGWIAVSLARPEDRDLIPAWTGAAPDDDPWEAILCKAGAEPAATMVESGTALHLPVAKVGETRPPQAVFLRKGAADGTKVIDLSALWAGPYCGGLLAEAGLEVMKIESPDRPDPTPASTPMLDARLNGGKEKRRLPLASDELMGRIAAARMLITSARPHALQRLGLTEARLFALNPGLLWIAITAHGWHGDAAMRVGFGDDCAAAGGLVGWAGDEPHFLGDALADPLTGLTAATLALEALAAGQAGLLDIALAPTAATFAASLQ